MDEFARLGVLHEQAVLDTPPEARFDRITAMAAAHFKAPIALVSLVDTNRQWFKSCIGLDVRETERGCVHAVLPAIRQGAPLGLLAINSSGPLGGMLRI